MADLIVTNAVVVTVAPWRRVLHDAAIAIQGDRIVDIGPTVEVTARHPAREIVDGSDMVVLPGLVDAHAHAGHGFIKTLASGDSARWFEACRIAYTVASTPEFWHAEAQLAALERTRFGVTTGVSLLGGGDSIMRTDDPAYGDAHCEGVLEVGTRSVVAIGTTRPPHPLTYARWNGTRHDYPVDFETQLATSLDLLARWHGTHGRRINIALLSRSCGRRRATRPPMPTAAKRLPKPVVSARRRARMASSSPRMATGGDRWLTRTHWESSDRKRCFRTPPA